VAAVEDSALQACKVRISNRLICGQIDGGRDRIEPVTPCFEFFPRRLLLSPSLVLPAARMTSDFQRVKRASIPSVQRAILTFFTTTFRFPVRNLNLAELVRPKTDAAPSIMSLKSPFDCSRADLAELPVSKQVLEGFSFETTARLIAEDQFGIADRCVLFLIPRLPYAEVAEQVRNNAQLQRNLYERIEDFRGLGKGRICPRHIQHLDFELPE
jgi:hypothetical protein